MARTRAEVLRARTGGGRAAAAAVRLAACALAALAAFPPLHAAPLGAAPQDGREERPEVDPYTEGRPKALERAGYLSFGSFLVAGRSTEQIVEDLGGEPLLWVETEHFRLGSSLDSAPPPDDPQVRKALEEELDELAKKLPALKRRKPKGLDPWLRLHLYAQRLEQLRAAFCEELDLEDADFAGGKAAGQGPMAQVGSGPHLGMRGKPVVLLFERTAPMARFTAVHLGGPQERAYRHYFGGDDSFLYMTSAEQLTGSYAHDKALHCAVAFGVVQNLANGLRGYSHDAPPWLQLGLARWFIRGIDPRWQLYTAPAGEYARGDEDVEWAPKVRARIEHEYFPTMAEILGWRDPGKLGFADHMMLWSRVDHLARMDRKTLGAVAWRVKEPVPWNAPERDKVLAEQFEQALVEGSGKSLEELDRAWSAWVLKTYPK